jgi:hypothetical protein
VRGRAAISLALRIGVVAAAAGFLARGVRWGELAGALRTAGAHWPLVALVGLGNAAMLGMRAERLRLLLAPAPARLRDCLAALVASSALNNVTPLRGGDVARLFMLERDAGVAKTAAVAVAAVEKLLELGVLGALAAGAALFAPGQGWARLAGLVVAAVASLALLALRRALRRGGAAGAAGGGTRLGRLAARLEPGTRALGAPGVIAKAAGLSAVAWLAEAVMIVVAAHAVGLALAPAVAVVALLGVNLAIALPSAPASAGPFEGALVVVLGFAAVGKPAALAFALLYHAVLVVPVTLVGLALVVRRGSSAARRAVRPGAAAGPAWLSAAASPRG